MMKTEIRQLVNSYQELADKTVIVQAWVRSNRFQKNFGFLAVNDGTHFRTVQIVYEEANCQDFDDVARLRTGVAVEVTGQLILTPQAKQAFEIRAIEVKLLGDAGDDYPIQPKRHTREFLREVAHLRPRTNLFSAVFRVRSLLSYLVHQFFQERGFVYLQSPIITGNDAEGAGEMFELTGSEQFFGQQAHLTVSGQLQGEAFALAFKNIYTFGPTFRAENSNTSRHAAEFWMIEPELAFADLQYNMQVAEKMLKFLVEQLLIKAPEEMQFFNQHVDKELLARLQNIIEQPFAQVSYTEAIKLLEQATTDFNYPVKWGADLQSEHERYLAETLFQRPVFVTDYPKDIKAFYMRMNDDNQTVAAVDLLIPGVGELIGGSQREERLELLEARMQEMNVSPEELWWYLDLRRYGGVEHAGFGLGFERLLMYVTGINNIRDVIAFPRVPGYCKF